MKHFSKLNPCGHPPSWIHLSPFQPDVATLLNLVRFPRTLISFYTYHLCMHALVICSDILHVFKLHINEIFSRLFFCSTLGLCAICRSTQVAFVHPFSLFYDTPGHGFEMRFWLVRGRFIHVVLAVHGNLSLAQSYGNAVPRNWNIACRGRFSRTAYGLENVCFGNVSSWEKSIGPLSKVPLQMYLNDQIWSQELWIGGG